MPDPIVNVCGTGGWSGPLPGDPDNNVTLTATARYDGVMVAWTEPLTNPHAVAVYRLYRGVSADPAASVLYAAVGGNRYFDQSQVEHPPRYYYWIEVLSVNGTVGAKIGPASAQANDTIEDLIEKLTGKIEEGQLSNALKAELDVITSLNDTLIAEVANRINDNGVLAGIIAAAQAEVATALTYIYDETQSRIDGDAATLASYNVLAAAVGSSLAALVTEINLAVTAGTANASAISELTASVGDDIAALSDQVALNVTAIGANASAITTLSTSLGEDIAAVATTAETNINALTGEVNALYTAKVTVNGLVGGFGLANDGASVEAGFDVDTFWVGKTSADKRKPFIIDDGIVYIDSAMVGTLTADQIDTRGLTIKDNLGNVIFGAGNNLDWSRLTGSGRPADNATRNVFRGDWATATVYQIGDIVMEAGYGWAALAVHTSSAIIRPPVYPVASNTQWTLFSLKGDPGLPGTNGTRTAILEMYRNSAAAPTTFPAGNSTYTWETGQFTDPSTLNSWSRTPPAPVGGQDLWVVRQLYSDNLTSLTSVVGWAATTSRISAASGEPGADGINGARTAYLEVYKWSTDTPVLFPTGTSTYTWATGEFTAPSTANGWALVPGAQSPGQTLWAYATRQTNTTTVTTDTVTWATSTPFAIGAAGINGAAGANAVTALLSNEAHVFPAAANGTVASYLDSGTQIRVYEGTTELVYNGVGTSASTWTISSAVVNITRGALTSAGSGLSVGVHSGVAAGTDVSSITYTITGRNAANQAFTLVKTQTFSKSKTGAVGNTGPTGLSASAYWLQTSAPAIQKSLAGAYTPASVTYSIFSATGTAAPAAYAGRFIIATSTDGTTYGAPVYTSAVNESSRSYTIPAGIKTVRVRAYLADGTTTLVDELISTVVSDGATGGTGDTGPTGLDGITVVLSNEAHNLPASTTGVVSSYAGSGTTVAVYEGSTALSASAVAVVSAFRIGAVTQNPLATLTPGTASYAGTIATIANHAAMVDATDSVLLTIPVTIYRANGTSVTVNKLQTLTKSKAGATGPAGPTVVLTSDRFATFTATDGVIDGAQANIILTATTQGLSSPSFVWTFSGLQTNPTASSTGVQTITSAQFGTSKAAIITCTVNGLYVDKITIVRLEKSTAAAGATVGAPAGTLVNGIPVADITTAVANFNTSNDRNSGAVAAPTIPGTLAVEHTLQTDGSADVSFDWLWGGNEGDIDGFIVFVRQSTSATTYAFGTTPAEETAYNVPANKRAFIVFGTAVDKYYTFGIQAYRLVDKDINASGVIKSALVKVTTAGMDPYRPSATVAFSGNVTGTIDGSAANTVRVNAANALANAATAQAQANTATTNAATAQTAANTANTAITNIASDNILSPGEKPAVKLDYDTIIAEQAGIQAQATSYSITTEKTTYDNAVSALTTYLGTLTGWNTIPGLDVVIVGTTFRSNFQSVYTARQALLNKIAANAKVLADTAQTQANTGVTNAAAAQTTANTAIANAATAQTAANTAQTSANTANTAISNIASDSILSPGEKPAVKLDYDTLIAEQAGIGAQATAYAITTEKTTYDTAVSALTTYLGTLTGWNTIPGSDVTIVGTTFRSKFQDVYTARQALLNKIAANAKVLADTAQTQANTAVTNAATAQATANTAVTNAATAQTAANSAQTSANTANTAITNIASDNILSPGEKPTTKLDYDTIIAEQTGIGTQATAYGVTTEKTTYDTAVTALTTYLGTLTGWNTIPGSDVVIVGTTFRSKFQDVYVARQALLNKIAANAKTLADAAQAQANTATTNASTAQTTANTAVTNAATAQTTANTANSALADIASDSKFTPVEKQSAKLEWAALYAEKAGINSSAAAQGITTENDAYNAAFTALANYLHAGTWPVGATHPSWIEGANLATTTDIVGSTFRTTWANVYSARQALLNKIAEVASTKAVWSTVSGTGRPADNATVGATIGVNLGGQITAGNASTFIANAAIGNAQIGGTIQSSDFVTGSTGWAINKAGTAELNNATFRGQINVGNYTGYASPASGGTGAHLSSLGLLLGNPNASAGNPGGKYFEVHTPVGGAPYIATNIPAYIENLQVSTLKIANNAVTLPISTVTLASDVINENVSTIQSLTFTATGAPVFIHASWQLAAYSSVSGEYGVTQSIKRNGVNLIDTGALFGNNNLVFLDRPPAGSVTYTLQVNTIQAASGSANKRILFALETKK